jgi:hypothetical protein
MVDACVLTNWLWLLQLDPAKVIARKDAPRVMQFGDKFVFLAGAD